MIPNIPCPISAGPNIVSSDPEILIATCANSSPSDTVLPSIPIYEGVSLSTYVHGPGLSSLRRSSIPCCALSLAVIPLPFVQYLLPIPHSDTWLPTPDGTCNPISYDFRLYSLSSAYSTQSPKDEGFTDPLGGTLNVTRPTLTASQQNWL